MHHLVKKYTISQFIIQCPNLNFSAQIFSIKTGSQEDIDLTEVGKLASAIALSLCPEGIDRCECANKNNTISHGPFHFLRDPIGVSLEQLTCSPDFCYCKDTPTVRRDARTEEQKALFDLCPRHKMSRCLCHDNTVVKFPFDLSTIFFTCRPKKVRFSSNIQFKVIPCHFLLSSASALVIPSQNWLLALAAKKVACRGAPRMINQ